jgi:hypothetical protein
VLNIAAADGSGVVRTLKCPAEYCEPTDWTPHGLLVNVVEPSDAPDGRHIYMLRADETPAPRELHLIMGWRELIRWPCQAEGAGEGLITPPSVNFAPG